MVGQFISLVISVGFLLGDAASGDVFNGGVARNEFDQYEITNHCRELGPQGR